MEKQYLIVEWKSSSETIAGDRLVAHGPFRDPDYAIDWAHDELGTGEVPFRLCEYTPDLTIHPVK